jgi:subtilisin-like proprotein convertase family protein
VVLFAAGNGNESVDLDGYASYQNVLAVAACNDRGRRSVYSDKGDAVFCAFPSNDFRWDPENRPAPLTPGIWTTDVSGSGGYNPDPNTGTIEGDAKGNYTNSFGGTSSACPGAAGVAALVLARNPALRWQEVKDVLRRSCDRIDLQDGQWSAQGHSPLYGHGRLNAATAVELAIPQPMDRLVISRTYSEPVKDLQTSTVTLDVVEARKLADLKVQVDIRHSYIGDLAVHLLSPAAGREDVTLHNRTGGHTRDLRRTYDALDVPELAGFAGKSAQGSWTLQVRDEAPEDTGRIVGFGLELVFE